MGGKIKIKCLSKLHLSLCLGEKVGRIFRFLGKLSQPLPPQPIAILTNILPSVTFNNLIFEIPAAPVFFITGDLDKFP